MGRNICLLQNLFHTFLLKLNKIHVKILLHKIKRREKIGTKKFVSYIFMIKGPDHF
jgi:hypothetical protein